MKKIINFSMLLLIGMLHAETPAFSGGNSSGGGSGLALEFKTIAHDLYDYFEELPPQKRPDFFNNITLEDFHRTIEQCVVRIVERFSNEESQDELFTAKNYRYPDGTDIIGGLIEVKESRWRIEPQKAAVVLHELLGLLSIDRHYEVSHAFYNFSKNPIIIEFLNIFTDEFKKELSKTRGYLIDEINLNLHREFLRIKPDGNMAYENIGELSTFEFKHRVWSAWQFGITHFAANDPVEVALINTVKILNPGGSEWTREKIFEYTNDPWLGFIYFNCGGHKMGEIFSVLNRINDETN